MAVVTILFIWCIMALLVNIFGDKIIVRHPFFKGFLVEGEVTSFDEITIWNERYCIAIIIYTKYDMDYKTFVFRSLKDKEGDKISIYTDGDISVRDKIYWKKEPHFEVLLYDLIGILVSGGVLISNIQAVKWAYVGIGFLIVLSFLLAYPLLYSNTCSRVKNKLGYLYRYR